MTTAIIGLGSNLGDREAHLRAAHHALAALGKILRVSDVFETQPIGGPPQGQYLNAAIALETDLAPEKLLDALAEIEVALGRERSERWGPRTIDLDLLIYEGVTCDLPHLTLPHPRLLERSFARFPAVQVGAKLEAGPCPGPSRPFPS